MSNADPEVIERINELGDRVVLLEHEQETLIKDIEARKKAIDDENAPRLQRIETAARAAKQELAELIEANRVSLIAQGRQSFTTQLWKFQFTKAEGGKTTIIEGATDAIMKIAGKLGVIKQIAVPPKPQKWRFKQSRFLEWLEKYPEERSRFEEHLEITEDTEALRMSPNAGHVVFHDGTRISPPSTTLKSK